jgi:hypothetical protein
MNPARDKGIVCGNILFSVLAVIINACHTGYHKNNNQNQCKSLFIVVHHFTGRAHLFNLTRKYIEHLHFTFTKNDLPNYPDHYSFQRFIHAMLNINRQLKPRLLKED